MGKRVGTVASCGSGEAKARARGVLSGGAARAPAAFGCEQSRGLSPWLGELEVLWESGLPEP